MIEEAVERGVREIVVDTGFSRDPMHEAVEGAMVHTLGPGRDRPDRFGKAST